MEPHLPRRRFSQNFLVDRSAVDRIVAALSPPPGATVLEIGPGTGALTAPLAARGRVVAVEIDRDLAARLRETFPDGRVEVVEEDVLAFDFSRAGDDLLVAGNLPYHVSKPVVAKLVAERARVAAAVLMFQKEVAERLTASPGSPAYGPLTIAARLAFDVETLFDLPAAAFRPRPKVVSTVTRWRRLSPGLDPAIEGPLREVVRIAFAARRKTLLANFRAALGDEQARALLAASGVEPETRAERLSPEDFVRLARLYSGR